MNQLELTRVLSDIDSKNVEDLYLAKSALQAIDNGYQGDDLQSPEWVINGISSISREITSRNRIDLERRLKTLTARREGLATPDEKRKKLDEQIASLTAKLK